MGIETGACSRSGAPAALAESQAALLGARGVGSCHRGSENARRSVLNGVVEWGER